MRCLCGLSGHSFCPQGMQFDLLNRSEDEYDINTRWLSPDPRGLVWTRRMYQEGFWSWWGHDMETLSALLALCEGNPFLGVLSGPGECIRRGSAHDEAITWKHFLHLWGESRNTFCISDPLWGESRNIFCITGPLWGESRNTFWITGPLWGEYREFPSQWASDAELWYFLWR